MLDCNRNLMIDVFLVTSPYVAILENPVVDIKIVNNVSYLNENYINVLLDVGQIVTVKRLSD